jgi:hypothetical protein
MIASPLPSAALRKHRLIQAIVGTLAALSLGLFIASFFLDGIVRERTETAMNQKLKGYHVMLAHAHVQLIGGILTLNNLEIAQQAHPRPAVANIPMMRFHIEWKELFFGRIVSDVSVSHPMVQIDQTQFVSERNDQRPLEQKGWQDALESAYPLKINRLTIIDGDILYIQNKASPPLHLARLNFITDNIRNIHSPNNVYPSSLHANLVVFGTGKAIFDGNANYLEEPFPGVRLRFSLENAPLSAFDPEIREINISVHGGRLSSTGLIEYSPKIARVEVDRATIEGVSVNYVHTPLTEQAEAQRVKAAGKQVEKENNRVAVELKVHEFDVSRSRFSFVDETTDPNYRLIIENTDLTINNLSNHQQDGPADLTLSGKFMGSGETKISGHFLASPQGPVFDLNVAIQNADLPSMNNLLRAYGRFDVAAGQFSLFSEAHIRNGEVNGYVKPMFANLEVYDYQKDKHTGALHQTKELMIGGASHIFKNAGTGQVATEVDLKGKLTSPDISTWQAIVEVLHNAFVNAILPGFDHAVE